ncbi:hypothetical protein ACFL1A_02145 [Patescibacteria group bacterium]
MDNRSNIEKPNNMFQKSFKTQVPGYIVCIFLILLGFSILKTSDLSTESNLVNIENSVLGYASIFFGSGLFVYLTIRLIKNPTETYKKTVEARQNSGIKNFSSWLKNSLFSQDFRAYKILRKNPVFIIIFAVMMLVLFPISVMLLLALLLIFFESAQTQTGAENVIFTLFFFIIPIYFTIAFSFFNASVVSLILIGEILQTRIADKKFSLKEVIQDYIYSFPFIIILGLLGVMFIIFAKRSEKRGMLGFDGALGGLFSLTVFKYYTYLNLGIIVLENKPLSYSIKKSVSWLKEHSDKLTNIAFKSGASLIPLVLLLAFIFIWTNNVIAIILFGLIVIFFLIVLFLSEQISLLEFILDTRYPSIDKNKIFLL